MEDAAKDVEIDPIDAPTRLQSLSDSARPIRDLVACDRFATISSKPRYERRSLLFPVCPPYMISAG
jgi:hypothetical protein